MAWGFADDEGGHHVIRPVGESCKVVDERDVRMMYKLGDTGLTNEPIQIVVVGSEALAHHLDRSERVEVEMPGFVHFAHATSAEEGLDLVLSIDRVTSAKSGISRADRGAAARADDERSAVRGAASEAPSRHT